MKKNTLKELRRLSEKVVENIYIDINDIIFNEMNGYIPSFINSSIDEMIADIEYTEELTDSHFILAEKLIEYLLIVENHFDKRTKKIQSK